MKIRNLIKGLLFLVGIIVSLTAMGAPEPGGSSGGIFFSILPILFILGFGALWVWALVKIIIAYKKRKETPVEIKKILPHLVIAGLGLIYVIAQIIYNSGGLVLLLILTIAFWAFATVKLVKIYMKRKETPIETKKIVPFVSIFAVGLIILIIEITVMTSGPSTAKLEQQVLTSIQEQYGTDVTKVSLVKLEKGKYSGMVTVQVYGISTQIEIDVITDGRSIQWKTK